MWLLIMHRRIWRHLPVILGVAVNALDRYCILLVLNVVLSEPTDETTVNQVVQTELEVDCECVVERQHGPCSRVKAVVTVVVALYVNFHMS